MKQVGLAILKRLGITLFFIAVFIGFFAFESYLFKGTGEKDDADPNTIVVAVYPSLDKAYAKIKPDFEKLHPGVKVKLQSLGFGQHHSKLITTMAAKRGVPDVAAVEIAYIGQLGASGGFVNLNQAPYNAGRYKKDIVPYKWAQASVGTNKLVAMPSDIAPGCIFYRKDVMDKYGIKVNNIKTVEDMYQMGKKIVKDFDGDGTPDQWLVPNASYIFRMIFYSSPYRFFDKDGKPNLQRPIIKKAIRWAKKFRDAGLDAKVGDWSNAWKVLLDKGKIVYFPMGAWFVGSLKTYVAIKRPGKFRVAELPALKKNEKPMSISWGGTFLAIPKASKKKLLAWKFIKYATTRIDTQMEAFRQAEAFPSLMPAWKDKVFSGGVAYLGDQKARSLWISIAKRIPNVHTSNKDKVALDILMTALTEVLENKKDIDTALRDAQHKLENRMLIM